MESNDEPRGVHLAAAAMVSPLILAPVVTVVAILWARHASILAHPAAAAWNPPTVSRAIADHRIGDVFANWILGVCMLQGFAVARITQAWYGTAIVPSPPHRRPLMMAFLMATILLQISAIIGLLVLTHYDSSNYSDIHQWGSYLLFFGNGFSILFAGLFIWLDGRDRESRKFSTLGAPIPYDYYLQTRLCALVSAIGIFFGILFFNTAPLERWNDYGFRLVFAMCEIVLLIGSVIFLASFVLPMYRYERHLLGRRSLKRQTT